MSCPSDLSVPPSVSGGSTVAAFPISPGTAGDAKGASLATAGGAGSRARTGDADAVSTGSMGDGASANEVGGAASICVPSRFIAVSSGGSASGSGGASVGLGS
jgi:hypothetical protein